MIDDIVWKILLVVALIGLVAVVLNNIDHGGYDD